jgi:manganese/iron transport system ATP-binding protein
MSSTSASDPAPSIEISGLTVGYRGGTVALHDVTLSLNGFTICGLVGMNGAGKSTLFKAIMGFLAPSAGSISISGRPLRWAQKNGAVAYVPQTEEVDWTFPVSVRDVVTMGRQGRMGFLRIPSAEDRRIVSESLERVGMSAYAARQIGELSGGQRKRVFLARALAQEARIVLLDEPFTGVDVGTERAIVDVLQGLKASGQLILVSTHNLGSVPEFCDEVILLNRALVASGPVAEVYTPENLGRTFESALQQLPFGLVAVPGGRGLAPPVPLGLARARAAG